MLAVDYYAESPVQEAEFLDRLRARYNSSLKRLHTPDDVIKLVARLLLETGRAAEARELLEPLLKPRDSNDPPSDQPAPDPEAAWLSSRAALQLGAHDTADQMLALAGDFGKSAAAQVEPSPFTGSKRCGECHRTIYRAQQRASRHAQTLRFGTDLKDVPLPHEPIADAVVSGITHSFKRTSDREIEMLSQKGSIVFRAIVDYAVGSGRHGITMLGRDEEGIERELRVSYTGLDGTWRQTKGITFAPQQPGDYNGMAHRTEGGQSLPFVSLDMVSFGCSGQGQCTTAGGRGPWNRLRALSWARVEPRQSRRNRICRDRDHARREDSHSAQLSSCVECHSEDGTVPPSDPEFTRFQGTTFLYSRCFIANQDRFACTTCHDPHGALETDSTPYEAKCLGCHAPEPLPRRHRQPPNVGKCAPSTPPRIAFHATCRRYKIRRGMHSSRTITFGPTAARATRRTVNPASGESPSTACGSGSRDDRRGAPAQRRAPAASQCSGMARRR